GAEEANERSRRAVAFDITAQRAERGLPRAAVVPRHARQLASRLASLECRPGRTIEWPRFRRRKAQRPPRNHRRPGLHDSKLDSTARTEPSTSFIETHVVEVDLAERAADRV